MICSPSQMRSCCQVTFISIPRLGKKWVLKTDKDGRILQNHRPHNKIPAVPAPLWCHSPPEPSFHGTLWPCEGEEEDSVISHFFLSFATLSGSPLSNAMLPPSGHGAPVEPLWQKMDASFVRLPNWTARARLIGGPCESCTLEGWLKSLPVLQSCRYQRPLSTLGFGLPLLTSTLRWIMGWTQTGGQTEGRRAKADWQWGKDQHCGSDRQPTRKQTRSSGRLILHDNASESQMLCTACLPSRGH